MHRAPLLSTGLCRALLACLAVCAPLWARADPVPAQLSRAEARRLLLEHSPLLGVEALELELEGADVRQASLRPNPVFSASSEGLGSSAPGLSPLDHQELSLTLGLELETAGKRSKRVRVQELEVEVRRWLNRDLERRLRFDLDRSYWELALAQADLEAVSEIRGRFSRVVQLNRLRFEQGEISGAELRRTEAEAYRIEEEVIAAELRRENAQDELLALLGSADLDQSVRAADPLETPFDPPARDSLRQAALAARPDLGAERERLSRAEAVSRLERARRVPNLVPFAGYRRDFGADGAIVGLEIDLPLFAKNQGNIARSEVRIRQQQRRIRLRELAVAKELQLALNQLESDRRRAALLGSEHLPKLRESLQIVETSYRLGEAPLLELLDVERSYGETVRRYHEALRDFRVSVARLEFAVGKELQP